METSECDFEKIRTQPCCVCSEKPRSDVSHIRSRGAGGPDTWWNCVPMCRVCHSYWHMMGFNTFCQRYPVFLLKLSTLGWTLEGGKLWHPELRK